MREKLIETDRKLSDVEERIVARHQDDVVFEWFQKSSGRLWKSIEPVMHFFHAAMKRGKVVKNPILGIAFLLIVLVSGLITVGFLSLIVAPILQIILVIVAMIAAIVRAVLKTIRVIR